MKNEEVSNKVLSTAIKLLECAEKAAEQAAANCSTSDLSNVQEVVSSALKLIEYHDNYCR